MITIAYQSIQYLNIEIENLTKEDIQDMSDDEIVKLVEDTYVFNARDDFSCTENTREIHEILDDNNNSIKVIERDNET